MMNRIRQWLKPWTVVSHWKSRKQHVRWQRIFRIELALFAVCFLSANVYAGWVTYNPWVGFTMAWFYAALFMTAKIYAGDILSRWITIKHVYKQED